MSTQHLALLIFCGSAVASSSLRLGGARDARRAPQGGVPLMPGEGFEPNASARLGLRNVLERAGSLKERTLIQLWVVAVLFILITIACCVPMSIILYRLWLGYRKVLDYVVRQRMTFSGYVHYRFEYWFEHNDNSSAIVLTFLTASLMIAGSMVYLFVGPRWDIAESMRKTLIWMMSPDAGAGEETTRGAFAGATISIAGLILFALLLTMIQTAFTDWLDSHKTGETPIIEVGHIVLIGIQEHTCPVITELCKAYEAVGGKAIVVLANQQSKQEMEENLAAWLGDYEMCGSRVMVRQGDPHSERDLKHVAADCAHLNIILPDMQYNKELRDAQVLRTLIAIKSSGWPVRGRNLVVCSLLRNKELFVRAGGINTDVVVFENYVSKLMVQGSRQWGLGQVMAHAFSAQGETFHIAEVPEHLVDKNISEASLHYPSAVICGVGTFLSAESEHHKADKKGDMCELCPGITHKLKKGEHLIVLSNGPAPQAEREPCVQPRDLTSPALHEIVAPPLKKQEKILVIGWNSMIGRILHELELICGPGSEVEIVSPKSEEDRMELLKLEEKRRLCKTEQVNISSIKHTVATLGSRYALEELNRPVEHATKIFILSDEDAPGLAEADTTTLGVVLQIRDCIIKARGSSQDDLEHDCIVVPEIKHPASRWHCEKIKIGDFIDTCMLPSQILGLMAYQPHCLAVIKDIISESGHVNFLIRRLGDYVEEPPASVSFFELQSFAAPTGDVVVGWSQPVTERSQGKKSSDEFNSRMKELLDKSNPHAIIRDWELNPADKSRKRPWDASDDLIVVLHPLKDVHDAKCKASVALADTRAA